MKLYIPVVKSITISVIYLLYTQFEEMYFYKSIQNKWSPEFYIVCKKRKKTVDSKTMDELLKLLTKFNNHTIMKIKDIPKSFIKQLKEILQNLTNSFDKAIERNIYYLDNYEIINTKYKKMLQNALLLKNKQWCKLFKIKKNVNSIQL